MSWVNIWQDDEAATFVAEHRGGNETVPTAVTGAGELVEASSQHIKSLLALP